MYEKYYVSGIIMYFFTLQIGKIIIHENFLQETLVNDIALVELENEVTFTKFIQPACLWYKNAHEKLPPGPVMGTVSLCFYGIIYHLFLNNMVKIDVSNEAVLFI